LSSFFLPLKIYDKYIMTAQARTCAGLCKFRLFFGFFGHFTFPFGGISNRRNTLIAEKAVNPCGQERYEGVEGYDSNEKVIILRQFCPAFIYLHPM
jgi:hypothetical protein